MKQDIKHFILNTIYDAIVGKDVTDNILFEYDTQLLLGWVDGVNPHQGIIIDPHRNDGEEGDTVFLVTVKEIPRPDM